MVLQEPLTLKTIFLHDEPGDPAGLPAYRLLNDLGHDVSAAASAQQAMELLQQDRTDLVVVDADEHAEFVSRLTDLPDDRQPRELAIFSDSLDENLGALRRKLGAARVHVLLKPLHVHGLLGVLRHIEGKA